MVRTQIQLDEPTYEALRRIAHKRHASMSAIAREILSEHLSVQEGRKPSRFSFVAAGASGHADTSAQHDEVLSEAYR
ncbi:MAG: ribbon-helix-helix protein, CopG family [Armatimonadota bacterium]